MPVTLSVAQRRPALIWFDGAGALRAIESHGPSALGNERVSLDETGGTILTLDGKDLRHSRALLLMPLRAGTIQWRSVVTWTEPVVETGEIRGGSWQTFERRSPGQPDTATMRVPVSVDQRLNLLLVCEQSALGLWRSTVERAMVNPASLP
jgi:hypothetical protein